MKKFLFLSIALLACAAMIALPDMGFVDVGVVSAMSYVAVSVGRPMGNPGAGGNKKDRITFYDMDEVQTFPNRDGKGVKMDGNIVMKSGKYMIQVYGTLQTIANGFTTEGDPDKRGFLHNLVFEHPGNSTEIREFVQNWTNKNIGAIVEPCGGTADKIHLGTPCSPLQLSTEAMDNNDGNMNTLTFNSLVKTQIVPGTYEGTLTLESPLAVIAADVATPDVALGEGQYQLTDGSATVVPITSLTNAQHGKLYTLLGSGGSNPSEIAGGDFILKDGVAWTATAGSQITFRAYKDGASSFAFIETSRA